MTETLIPQIQKLISDETIANLKSKGMPVVIKGLYSMLPSPVRFVVKEESFTAFCMSNQEKIFGGKQSSKKAIKKTTPKKQATKKLKKK